MEKEAEMTLTCRYCGKSFIFNGSEQEFYRQKGFSPPTHCRECRTTRKSQDSPLVCTTCGTKVENSSAVYCAACLGNVRLEIELETNKLKATVGELTARLSTVESEKAQMNETFNAKLAALESEKAKLMSEASTKMVALESERDLLVQEAGAKQSASDTENAHLSATLEQQRQTSELQEQLNIARIELEKALKYRVALEA